MTPLAALPNPPAAGQLALAALLAAVGFVLLLPKPRARSVMGGTAALVAAAAVAGVWAHTCFGDPAPDWVGKLLFILFSTGAVGFGTALVVQRNPARGAIAFAFVILSTCGLFLLLAAPFLMAATIIIYAGAIIVTFLFVLMLSHVEGPSDENDRSREPLLGSLAGFAFVGLVLFAVQQTRESVTPSASAFREDPRQRAFIPAPVLTDSEREVLGLVLTEIDRADDALHGDLTAGRSGFFHHIEDVQRNLEEVVGVSPRKDKDAATIHRGSLTLRLEGYRTDLQAKAVLGRAAAVRELNYETFARLEKNILSPRPPDVGTAKADLRKLRDEVRLLLGTGELPARNVANVGMLFYADHLLAVELAGTLLLVATVGAVAIAHRRGRPQP